MDGIERQRNGGRPVATMTAEEILGQLTKSFATFAEDHKAAVARETLTA